MNLARYFVYVLTLPFWAVCILVYVLGVTVRCVVAMFGFGWDDGVRFAYWVFKVESTNLSGEDAFRA